MQPDIFKKIIFTVLLFLLVLFSSIDIERWAQGIFRRKELKKTQITFVVSFPYTQSPLPQKQSSLQEHLGETCILSRRFKSSWDANHLSHYYSSKPGSFKPQFLSISPSSCDVWLYICKLRQKWLLRVVFQKQSFLKAHLSIRLLRKTALSFETII